MKPRETTERRLARLEQQVQFLAKYLGVELPEVEDLPEEETEWQRIARDPRRKIEAIKLYRETTGLGLKEAKDAVEAWMAEHGY